MKSDICNQNEQLKRLSERERLFESVDEFAKRITTFQATHYPRVCAYCGEEIKAPHDIWIANGEVFCSQRCTACALGVDSYEFGDEEYDTFFQEKILQGN